VHGRYGWRVASPSLSVVMPVRNEAAHLPATLAAMLASLQSSGFDAELVLVDDGSDDGSAAQARAAVDGRLPLRIVRRAGEGRFAARRAGLDAAGGDFALLLDARVSLGEDALRFVHGRLVAGEDVWNAHVHVDDASPFGAFWKLLAELTWRDYFDAPRTTSFGVDDFDRFPKGTTCFLAPRTLLLRAFDTFRTRYRDIRLANDDTPVLRAVAAEKRIHISPSFGCTYSPRTSAESFFRHALHRGTVFVDGHSTPESRFFPFVLAFFPLSAALAVAAVKRPFVVPAALAGCGAVAAAYGASVGRPPRDVRTLALVTPLYVLGHGLGMWRGAFELLR
jgi:glycosyltransferase involved in cell wall biosynthesis